MSTTWLEGASGRMLRPVHAHMQNKSMINVHHSRMATRQMCRWGCKADKIDWQGRLAAGLARHTSIWIYKADKMDWQCKLAHWVGNADVHTQRQH